MVRNLYYYTHLDMCTNCWATPLNSTEILYRCLDIVWKVRKHRPHSRATCIFYILELNEASCPCSRIHVCIICPSTSSVYTSYNTKTHTIQTRSSGSKCVFPDNGKLKEGDDGFIGADDPGCITREVDEDTMKLEPAYQVSRAGTTGFHTL